MEFELNKSYSGFRLTQKEEIAELKSLGLFLNMMLLELNYWFLKTMMTTRCSAPRSGLHLKTIPG